MFSALTLPAILLRLQNVGQGEEQKIEILAAEYIQTEICWKLTRHRYILGFWETYVNYAFLQQDCVSILAVSRVFQSSPLLKKFAKPYNFRLLAKSGKQHCMSLHLVHVSKSCPQVLEAEVH